MFETLGDEDLINMMHTQANVCVRVMEMPIEVRIAPGPKGEASPEQAGAFNAMLCSLAEQEATRRGLIEEKA